MSLDRSHLKFASKLRIVLEHMAELQGFLSLSSNQFTSNSFRKPCTNLKLFKRSPLCFGSRCYWLCSDYFWADFQGMVWSNPNTVHIGKSFRAVRRSTVWHHRRLRLSMQDLPNNSRYKCPSCPNISKVNEEANFHFLGHKSPWTSS